MLGTLIVGAGPAGLGPLIAAARLGGLDDWLEHGLTVIEKGDTWGGAIGGYNLNADTLATTFLECLEGGSLGELFQPLREHETTKQLQNWPGGTPPLALIGDYLANLGQTLQDRIIRHSREMSRPRTVLDSVHLKSDGSIEARIHSEGVKESIRAESLVLALGGYQDFAQSSLLEPCPGVRLRSIDQAKIMLSDCLLTADGIRNAMRLLGSRPGCRVAILGGSHSAFSAAWALTNLMPPEMFSAGSIQLLYRNRVRIFYPSAEEALADGYSDFTAEDICPVTRRVFRLGGLRADGRQLWRRLSARPGAEPETRVVLQRVNELSPSVFRRQLEEADLVICALGYRPRTVPVFDASGRRVPLMADRGQRSVDSGCHLRRADGRALPNVFSLGLASGYLPHGYMGGEASFVGQQNSLWLYQNDIGQTVYQGVMNCLRGSPHPASALHLVS
jgi:Pyridine nucleotide-disulphide oxidoreductase